MPGARVLVYWDVDGTLMRGEQAAAALLWETVCNWLGIEPVPRPPLGLGGKPDGAAIAEALQCFGIPAQDWSVRAVLIAHERALEHRLARSSIVFARMPGIRRALESIRRAGIEQRVLSMSSRQATFLKLRSCGLADIFNDNEGQPRGVFCAARESRHDLVRAAREQAGRDTVVIVGDAVSDITAARQIDAYAIGLASGAASADELATAGAHLVLSDDVELGEILARAKLQGMAACVEESARP